MEAERRSTMSSLKGQLSNVEGSVKSMKVAVVVGSVLTVACLAAVFGVTVLANEVSKEVKVSNGVLATKAGSSVLTATLVATEDLTPSGADSSIAFSVEGKNVNAKVASSVTTETDFMYVVDGAIVKVNRATGQNVVQIAQESLLGSVLETSVEARAMNWIPLLIIAGKFLVGQAVRHGVKVVGTYVVGRFMAGVYEEATK
jgi:hypothetical protein